MIYSDEIKIIRTTQIDDGYGGYTESTTNEFNVKCKVSVSDDELKVLSNGYGFYKKITIITDNSTDIQTNDTVIYNNVKYSVVSVYPTKRLFVYKGYQI